MVVVHTLGGGSQTGVELFSGQGHVLGPIQLEPSPIPSTDISNSVRPAAQTALAGDAATCGGDTSGGTGISAGALLAADAALRVVNIAVAAYQIANHQDPNADLLAASRSNDSRTASTISQARNGMPSMSVAEFRSSQSSSQPAASMDACANFLASVSAPQQEVHVEAAQNLVSFDEESLSQIVDHGEVTCRCQAVAAPRTPRGVTRHFPFNGGDGSLTREWSRTAIADASRRQNQYLQSLGTTQPKPEPSRVILRDGTIAVLIVAQNEPDIPADAAEVILLISNGGGGGTQMILEAMRKALLWGKSRLVLSSVPTALGFYERIGFVVQGVDPDGLIRMSYNLLQDGGFPRSEGVTPPADPAGPP